MRLTIPPGTAAYFGRPAKPAPAKLVDSLKGLVATFAEIREAHLPQCWVQGVTPEPAEILVVVLSEQFHRKDDLAYGLESKIAALLPPGFHLDIWVLRPDEPILQTVRKSRCLIWENPDSTNTRTEIA